MNHDVPAYLLFLTATGLALATALGAWVWHLRLRNAGVIDLVWGANLALASLVYAALGPGWAPRRWLLATMVSLTGTRLSYYLGRRVLGHPEEGRYAALREEWGAGGRVELKFLGFFLFQAFLVGLLSAPFLASALNATPGFGGFETAALGIFLLGFAGESLADRRLAAFKANPANKGRTCREGLWRYSRHPNYFFEWTLWLSYWLYACGSPWGWATVLAPALMLHFLLNVTGVKATEEQCLRSRGEDYARYQRETSAFVPWFPKVAPMRRNGTGRPISEH
jgi:steroid 5-alpha reductase family enzyme